MAGLLAIAYPDITLLTLAIFVGINLILVSLWSLVEAFSSSATAAPGRCRRSSACSG